MNYSEFFEKKNEIIYKIFKLNEEMKDFVKKTIIISIAAFILLQTCSLTILHRVDGRKPILVEALHEFKYAASLKHELKHEFIHGTSLKHEFGYDPLRVDGKVSHRNIDY